MEYKKISEICIINPENISKNYEKDYINYLDTANITKNKIDEIVKLNLSNAPSRAKRLVKKNDIIYSTVRPNLCHYGLVDNNYDDTLVVSTGFAVLRVKSDINPLYVYVALTRKKITEKLHSIASSAVSAYPSIKPSDLGDVIIPVPSYEKQCKIVSQYYSIIKKFESNNTEMTIIENMLKAIYFEWFESNEIDKSSWIRGKLSDLCDFTNGYAFKSKDLLKEEPELGFKVFKQGNIRKDGGIDHLATKSYITLDSIPKNDKYLLKYGDVLMCMTDMKDNVVLLGHTAYMDTNDEYYVNQRVGLLRSKNNIHFGYIYLLTNSISFLNNLRSKANSGVQVNLSKEAIEDSEIDIAPQEIYDRFNEIINPLFKKLSLLSNENRKLGLIMELYIAKAFNEIEGE